MKNTRKKVWILLNLLGLVVLPLLSFILGWIFTKTGNTIIVPLQLLTAFGIMFIVIRLIALGIYYSVSKLDCTYNKVYVIFADHIDYQIVIAVHKEKVSALKQVDELISDQDKSVRYIIDEFNLN
jgi:ACR3 family arsenite efflux pump ArsB